MRPPEFWNAGGNGVAPQLLAPLSLLFRAGTALRRLTSTPWLAPVPVICVGNITVGGSGKTPAVLALADRLQASGLQVACLSRGYGGRERGPLLVDPERHGADDVGDEPLLLARAAPTWVARDRKDGARVAISEGADVVILDDGLQNDSLRKTLSFVVVDGGYGFGNARVLPAGPLREPVEHGLARAAAAILVGDDTQGLAEPLGQRLPVLRANLVPDDSALRFRGRKVFAFAGIGRPAKFFATLTGLGAEIVAAKEFADHHRYSEDEAMRLVEEAGQLNAAPVTTAKDFVRLPDGARRMVTPIGVHLRFDDPEALDRLLKPALGAAHG